MKWEEAKKLLHIGYGLKRTDWGFYKDAFIYVKEETHIVKTKLVYIKSKEYRSSPKLYTLTYKDFISDCWEIVN
jgi:hypothetical protein